MRPGELAERRVLIVEGDPAATWFMERALAEHGGTVLGPTASAAGAIAWVLAAALRTRGVPCVIITAGRTAPPRARRGAPRRRRWHR